ncbi:MAG TPA: GNAT family N-acetyltransferase [Candidatus Poseidoniaceae archaeon]|nr:MAG TPA: GNAT family N-acetyltransferase [Candidatus Poseidoniales archaeon]HIH53698.1 GNAT family N-acetyltransferase [Candidatus Poseidoniaceae archaeon]
MGAEQDVRWLVQRLREEGDLRPPYRLKRERRWVEEATALRDDEGNILAYTELRQHLFAAEVTTVVVDPEHRGKGLSHDLIRAAITATPARPLILFTRSKALETAVARLGFVQRRPPNPLTLLSVGLRALLRCVRMLTVGDVRKFWTQLTHLRAFRCWVLAEKPDE